MSVDELFGRIIAAERMSRGIGLVFNGDGLIGVDLDDCRDLATGDMASWASDIIARLDTYCEVSPSQTGVKPVRSW